MRLFFSIILTITLGFVVFSYQESEIKWQPRINAFAKPPPQHLGAAVYRKTVVSKQMVTYGGHTATGYLNTPWIFDIGNLAQYATSPAESSSSYCTASGQWCNEQAFGPPEDLGCGDLDSAWEPRPAGAAVEWLQVSFATPMNATLLEIFESYNSRFVTKFVLFAANGDYITFVTNDTAACPGVFSYVFDPPTIQVVAVNISTSSPGWEGINAVRLSGLVDGMVGSQNGTVVSPHPPSRNGMVAGYNEKTDSMIIFGGRSTSYLGDSWTYSFSTKAWSQLIRDVSPPARHAAAAVVVPEGLLMFGGRCGDRCFLNDIWLLDFQNNTWRQIHTTDSSLPMASYGPSMSVINATHAAVFGGEATPEDSGTVYTNDLWLLNIAHLDNPNTTRWQLTNRTSTSPVPSERSFMNSLGYKGKFYVIAGKHVTGQAGYYKFEFLSDVWEFDFSSGVWTMISDKRIPDRAESTSIIVDGKIYLFGGRTTSSLLFTSGTIYDDFWTFDLESRVWTQLGQQPEERYYHASSIVEDRLYIVGGQRNDKEMLKMAPVVITLGTMQTSHISVLGTPPSPRAGMTAVRFTDRIVLFGGVDVSGSYNNELWELSVSGTHRWTKILPKSIEQPDACAFHTSVLVEKKMVTFGGLGQAGPLASLWEFDYANNQWMMSPVKSSSIPDARWNHVALAHRNAMIVAGGSKTAQNLGELQDVWIYYTNASWSLLGKEILREGLAASRILVVGNRIVVQGGSHYRAGRYSGDVTFVDGFMYAFKAPSSSIESLKSTPSAYSFVSPGRFGHSFVNLGREVFVFGGKTVQGEALNDVSSISDPAWKCGPGTFHNGSLCSMCAPGSFSNEFGAVKCFPCPVGTVGYLRGGSDHSVCVPCPYGTIGSAVGTCSPCPPGKYCGLGSVAALDASLQKTVTSPPHNPPPLESRQRVTNDYIVQLITIAAIVVGTILLVFLVIRLYSKALWQRVIQPVDFLFTSKHSQPLNSPVQQRKTVLGGALSILFILAASLMIGALIVPFVLNNEVETRALLPARIYDRTIMFNATMTFNVYGMDNTICTNKYVSVTPLGITRSGSSTVQTSGISCTTTWSCLDCGFSQPSAKLILAVDSDAASASAIKWKLESSSGIKNLLSVMDGVLAPYKGTTFRGNSPSIVHLKVVPVVYEDRIHFNNETGIQLALMSTKAGSNVTASTYHYAGGLRVDIMLTETETILSVGLDMRQSIQDLLSNFLGSLSGLLGAFVVLLGFLEFGKSKMKKTLGRRSEHRDIDMTAIGTPPDLRGVLLKKQRSSTLHVWREREFVVLSESNCISWRRAGMLSSGMKTIGLNMVISVEVKGDLMGLPEKRMKYGIVVHLDNGERIELCAMDEKDFQYWTKGLELWIEYENTHKRRRAGAAGMPTRSRSAKAAVPRL